MKDLKSKGKAILFLTQRIPWPPNKGEKIRSGALIRHLARNNTVYLAALIDQPSDLEFRDTVSDQVTDACIPFQSKLRSYLNALIGLLTGRPISFAFFWNHGLARWVEKTIAETQPDVIFVNSSNMAPYVARIAGQFLKVIDFVDVDSAKWDDYAKRSRGFWQWLYLREYRLVLAEERRLAEWADANILVTEDEAKLFLEKVPQATGRTFAIPNGVDINYFSPDFAAKDAVELSDPFYVFTGTMDYLPNIDAVTWFVEEVLPRIQEVHVNAKFYIVGQNPTPAVQRLANNRSVIVTGRVSDVRPYLAGCTAAVAPLRIARGIQNKVLEAMAMGRPTIATTGALVGIDAIHGEHVMCANTSEEFSAACVSLFSDRAIGKRIAAAGRTLVEERYSWPARLSAIDAIVEANSVNVSGQSSV